jgi:hypothetical protein
MNVFTFGCLCSSCSPEQNYRVHSDPFSPEAAYLKIRVSRADGSSGMMRVVYYGDLTRVGGWFDSGQLISCTSECLKGEFVFLFVLIVRIWTQWT